jgi:hypothetical protein
MDVEGVLRKQLNPAQYTAVTQMDGPMLVVAGAGTGKTRIVGRFGIVCAVLQKVSPCDIPSII